MKLLITTHNEASEIVSNPPEDLKAVVSIHSHPESRIATFENRHGKIQSQPCAGFDEFKGYKHALSFDDACVEGRDIYLPSKGQISQFLNWAEGVPDREGTILFHCHAGQSRSTALALGWVVFKSQHFNKQPWYKQELDEKSALFEVVMARPVAAPNILIVSYFDELLGCCGRLLKAVQDWATVHRKYKDEVKDFAKKQGALEALREVGIPHNELDALMAKMFKTWQPGDIKKMEL